MEATRLFGAIQVLRNADGGGGGVRFSGGKTLRRCKVQCYLRYEGVGGGPISRKKRYVTLEWPLLACIDMISEYRSYFHV